MLSGILSLKPQMNIPGGRIDSLRARGIKDGESIIFLSPIEFDLRLSQ
jgi:hypothetical protein